MATIILRVGQADLLACRFTTSPLFETLGAVRTFNEPRSRPYVLPWWRAVAAGPPPAAELRAVLPRRGRSPDFLSQPPTGPTTRLADQLARVRATPARGVAVELARTREDQRGTERMIVERLLDDPAGARDLLADALQDAWERLVEPWWPRIRELLDADITHRSRLLAERGLGPVVSDLHERVAWTDGAVALRGMATAGDRDLDGQGLALMPSAFVWPGLGVVNDRPWQPTLIYPARGIGELEASESNVGMPARLIRGMAGARPGVGDRRDRVAPAALAGLLGRTRAVLLAALAEPAATTTLAERHGLSPGGVSAHLAALHAAGLVAKRRHRHEVRYRRTPLGDALVAGAIPQE